MVTPILNYTNITLKGQGGTGRIDTDGLTAYTSGIHMFTSSTFGRVGISVTTQGVQCLSIDTSILTHHIIAAYHQKADIFAVSINASSLPGNFFPFNLFTVKNSGNVFIRNLLGRGTASPTAQLQLSAGTSTANTAPFKYTAVTNLTTVENGAKEYDGSNEFISAGGVRNTMAKTLTATTTLNFPGTDAAS